MSEDKIMSSQKCKYCGKRITNEDEVMDHDNNCDGIPDSDIVIRIKNMTTFAIHRGEFVSYMEEDSQGDWIRKSDVLKMLVEHEKDI